MGNYVKTGRPVGRPKTKKPHRGAGLMNSDGWRGGNHTIGPTRKGYRGGRTPLYPEGTSTWKPIITLSDQHCAVATYLGIGVLSKGVQVALDHLAKNLKYPPRTRAGAIAVVKSSRLSTRRDVAQALGLPEPALIVSGSNRDGPGAEATNEQLLYKRHPEFAPGAEDSEPGSATNFDVEVTQSELEEWEK